jgi:hypothetical protein
MDSSIQTLIWRLHQASRPLVLVFTGGGTTVAGWLLSIPGGSRTILEVLVPYAEQALCDFLGHPPTSFCSEATARVLARRARERAERLAPRASVAGLACTASLRSDRPKRGDHRFHLAIAEAREVRTWSLTLVKEARERWEEEEVLSRVALNALAQSCGISERVPVPLLEGEQIQEKQEPAVPGSLAALLAGQVPLLGAGIDGRLDPHPPLPGLLLAGSFNPLHAAHLYLAEVASRRLGCPCWFELTVVNADKPPLPEEEVRARLAQFTWRAPIYLTRAPTFAEKATLFPGAVFLVGADTAARIIQPRFYENSEQRLACAMAQLRTQGCRFLVAGRRDSAGHFVTIDELRLPSAFRDLFEGIPEQAFHLDLSSTALRRQS